MQSGPLEEPDMPRANKVWKRAGTEWYYAKIRGKKTRLSKDRAEAERLMHKLLCEEEERKETANPEAFPTFRKLADPLLVNSERVNKPNTFRTHKVYLQSFCDRVKRKRVNQLKVHHVTEWIAATGWRSGSTCRSRPSRPRPRSPRPSRWSCCWTNSTPSPTRPTSGPSGSTSC